MQYKSKEDYETKIKASGEWRKANNYEVFGWNICMECRYFNAHFDAGHVCSGDCSLMEKEGAYNGVMYDAVCDRYINRRGFDIDGKVVDPASLPAWIKTKKDKKTGQLFIVG
jgi:hypothetical protein